MRSVQQYEQPHGVPGQINIYVLDKDSYITSYGEHSRLIVFLDPAASQIEIREDDIGLPWSTHEQRMKVASLPRHRLHGKGVRLVFVEKDVSADGKQVWYRYAMSRIHS